MDSRAKYLRQLTRSRLAAMEPDPSSQVTMSLPVEDWRLILGALYLHRRRLCDLDGGNQSVRADEIALVIQDAITVM